MGLGQSSGDDEQETRDRDFLELWQTTQKWHRHITSILERLDKSRRQRLVVTPDSNSAVSVSLKFHI